MAYSVQIYDNGKWNQVAKVASRDAAMSIAKQNRKHGDKVRIVKRGDDNYQYPTQTRDDPRYR